jgi:hypothetical protein
MKIDFWTKHKQELQMQLCTLHNFQLNLSYSFIIETIQLHLPKDIVDYHWNCTKLSERNCDSKRPVISELLTHKHWKHLSR